MTLGEPIPGRTLGAAASLMSAPLSDAVRAVVMIEAQGDVLRARSAGREVARSLGFGTVDQTRLATAISEVARNALNYGRGGCCTIFARDQEGVGQTVRVVVEDQGPGIPNVPLALQPGFSSGGGLGQGLAAVRKLMDQLRIESQPGRTAVEMTMSRRR